MGIHVTKPRYY